MNWILGVTFAAIGSLGLLACGSNSSTTTCGTDVSSCAHDEAGSPSHDAGKGKDASPKDAKGSHPDAGRDATEPHPEAGKDTGSPPMGDAGVDALSFDASPCSLDPTFGEAGTVFVPFGDASAFWPELVLGDTLVAVSANDYSAVGTHVARYTLAGTPDPTFNGGSPLAINFGTGASEFLDGAFQQTDGKLVVYGLSFNEGYGYDLVARVNADGSLDETFGTHGVVVNVPPYQSPSTPEGRLSAGMELPDGSLLFGGDNAGGQGSWFLMHLSSAGDLDSSFGTGGFVDESATTSGSPAGIALQSNAEPLVYGSFETETSGPNPAEIVRWAVERYSDAGAVDPTYGGAGVVVLDASPGGYGGIETAQLDTTNRLTIAGGGTNDAGGFMAAARLMGGGAFDFSFNSGKLVTIPLGAAQYGDVATLIVDPSNRFILAGDTSNVIAVARLTSAGTLDTTCAGTGFTTLPVPSALKVAAALDTKGRLVVAGEGYSGSALGLWIARFSM